MKTTLLFSTFMAAVCMTAALPSYAADRTISSDYALTADETVDGVLTIEAGAKVDLAGHKLTVAGLAGAGTVTSSVAAVYRRLEYLESGGQSEEYKTAIDTMQRLCDSSNSTFIYVILPDRSD